jgi:Flp pilus assembly pilin Flp
LPRSCLARRQTKRRKRETKLSTEKHSANRRIEELQLESGQTTSEYAVVLVVLIPGLVLLFSGLGGTVAGLITSVARLFP